MHWLPKERDRGRRILKQQMQIKSAWMYRALILLRMLQEHGIDARYVIRMTEEDASDMYWQMVDADHFEGRVICELEYIGQLGSEPQDIWRCATHLRNFFASRGVTPESCSFETRGADDGSDQD